MLEAINRRALLQGGAAAGTLAISGGALAKGARPSPVTGPAPLEGALAAWVRVYPERGAELRLAHFVQPGTLAGQGETVWIPVSEGAPVSAWGQTRAACAHAERLAVGAASLSWGVPPDTCRVEMSRIVHPASGREITYQAWVDVI